MTLRFDLHHAARRLGRSPGFTAVAVATLALAIGAHTAIVGWAEGMFLRPLPVPGAERLVGIYETRDGAGFFPLSLPAYADYRERSRVFVALAAHYAVAPLVLGQDDGSRREILGSVVSPEYFSVLGLEPARGRFFHSEEAGTPGAHPVAVVSHAFWRSRLGGRDDALGRVLALNDTAFTVVGVAPEGFHGVRLGFVPEVWIPTSMAGVGYRWCDTSSRDCTWIEMIGRLAPGRTIVEARAELTGLADGLRVAYPSPGGPVRGLAVEPLHGVHPAERPRMLRLAGILGAAVTLFLLVAGANVGGILLARNVARQREIATRLAIGAARWMVVRECLAEAVLIACAGGVAGLAVAGALARLMTVFHPGQPRLEAGLPASALAYGAALSLVAGVGVGLVTGVQASRAELVAGLKGQASLGGRGRPRALGLVVAVQVALSFVLVTSTGLLARSLDAAGRLSAVEPDRVATLRLRPRLVGYDARRARPFLREVVRRVEALPGVESVAVARVLPPWSGLDAAPGEPSVLEVGPGFFETFGFRLVRGRPFDEGDGAGAPRVAVVNLALAETRWQDREAVGDEVVVGDLRLRVVGVVDDTVYRSLGQVPPPVVYTAFWQDPDLVDARLAVRTSGAAADLLPVLRGEARRVDPAVPATEAETLEARVDRLLSPVAVAERVLGASALLAVLLSAVGLYGVLAMAVAERTRDIGIRLALGGSRRRVVAETVRDPLAVVSVALGCGIAMAAAASRGLAHLLYAVSPGDPFSLAGALAVFALVSALASWWPARRASQVDPATALRQG